MSCEHAYFVHTSKTNQQDGSEVKLNIKAVYHKAKEWTATGMCLEHGAESGYKCIGFNSFHFFFFLPEMACAETWICTSYHVSFSKQTVQIILLPGMGSYLSGRTRAHIYTNRSSLFYVIIEADQLNYPQCQGLEILPAALSSFHCFPLLFLSKHINPYEVAFQTGLSSSLWRKENISM